MKNLLPYLTIPKRCEEALNFYIDSFGGTLSFLQRYSQTDYPVTPEYKNKIAHAEFIAEGVHFYASDGFEGAELITGNNIALNVNFSSPQERLTVYNKLKVNATITMPLSETTANSTLVTLIDQFGIHWYLNHNNEEI